MSELEKHPPWRLPDGRVSLSKVEDKRVTMRMKAEQLGRVNSVLRYNKITMSAFLREAVDRLLRSEEHFIKRKEEA